MNKKSIIVYVLLSVFLLFGMTGCSQSNASKVTFNQNTDSYWDGWSNGFVASGVTAQTYSNKDESVCDCSRKNKE